MLGSLPLTGDPTEGPSVYSCLLALFEANNPAAIGVLPELLGAFMQVLAKNSGAVDETKALAVRGLKIAASNGQYQGVLSANMGQIHDAELRQTIEMAIHS